MDDNEIYVLTYTHPQGKYISVHKTRSGLNTLMLRIVMESKSELDAKAHPVYKKKLEEVLEIWDFYMLPQAWSDFTYGYEELEVSHTYLKD